MDVCLIQKRLSASQVAKGKQPAAKQVTERSRESSKVIVLDDSEEQEGENNEQEDFKLIPKRPQLKLIRPGVPIIDISNSDSIASSPENRQLALDRQLAERLETESNLDANLAQQLQEEEDEVHGMDRGLINEMAFSK
jgi:hypothetical protein